MSVQLLSQFEDNTPPAIGIAVTSKYALGKVAYLIVLALRMKSGIKSNSPDNVHREITKQLVLY